MTPESASEKNRHHRSGSAFKRWRHRVRSSRTAQRELIQTIVIIVMVLIAFAIGFYYFGPSFSATD